MTELLRRYEIYPDPADRTRARWRAIDVKTGQLVGQSKGSFTTATNAYRAAKNETDRFVVGATEIVGHYPKKRHRRL